MHCYEAAAQYYQMPALILKAIHHVEGGKRGDRIPDANGTYDHGFMQINTCWKPLLRANGWSMRFITQHDCANIFAAAWILKQHLNQTHNLWLSVADYHSANPAYGYPYAQKVFQQVFSIEQKKSWHIPLAGREPLKVGFPKGGTPEISFVPQNVRFVQ